MEDLERKMIAEALNKIDKLVEIVKVLQDEIKIVMDQVGDTQSVAQTADNLLADQLVELKIKVEMQDILIQAMLKAPGQ